MGETIEKSTYEMRVALDDTERRRLETKLVEAEAKLNHLLTKLKESDLTQEELWRLADRRTSEKRVEMLEARVKILEEENAWLREQNAVLSADRSDAEIFSVTPDIPEKKIKSVGRPALDPWTIGQMKKCRKEGWTVREISEKFGRSVGAVQKAVSGVDPDPEVLENHRRERNQALKEIRKQKKKKD